MGYESKYYNAQSASANAEAKKAKLAKTSTAGLNDTGKAAAKNVKENIKTERQGYYDVLKSQMNDKIASLRAGLKALPKEQRKALKEQYKQKIANLRTEYKAHKASIKDYFDVVYESELAKIKADPSMRKVKKSSSTKKKKYNKSFTGTAIKKRRGRPKGAKDKKKRARRSS